MFTEKTNPHVSKPTQFNRLCKGQLYLGVWVCICVCVCVCVCWVLPSTLDDPEAGDVKTVQPMMP